MAEKYYSILTNRGKELEAQSSVTGQPVVIKGFVIGDGNGQMVTPEPMQTSLVHEVYRADISALEISPEQSNQWIARLVLPADVGGFTVREAGLLTEAGDLYAVSNCAAIEKPESGISVNIQFRLAVSETAEIELKVATGDGLFLRQDANLSDVNDKARSRDNLGLKGAAILDVGKTANSVAAGDDSRIENALQKENNLSELADADVARANLGLGSLAVQNANNVNITGGNAEFSMLSSSEDITVGGTILVNGVDYIEKNGVKNNAASKTNSTQGVRLNGANGQLADIYLWEQVGQYLALSFRVSSGGVDKYFSFKNDGTFTPANYSNFDVRYYSSTNPPPVLEQGSPNTWPVNSVVFASILNDGGNYPAGTRFAGAALAPSSLFYSAGTRAAFHTGGTNWLVGTWVSLGDIQSTESAIASMTAFRRIL